MFKKVLNINHLFTGIYMSEDHDEITLSIALLGGIIVILWNIIDYSNSQSLEFFSSLKPTIYLSISFLFAELVIIFLFFVFKGVSLYADNSIKEKFKPIAKNLFKFSFIIAFVWFLDILLIIILKMVYPPTGRWILFVYEGIFFITSVIVIKHTTVFDKFIIYKKLKNLSSFIKAFIIFFIIFIYVFYSILVPYLLTGSYSIEEVSIDNPDMLTFIMKEKGISYDLTEVRLYKLDTSDPEILIRKDNFTTNKREAKLSSYLWVVNINYVWYLNIINTSYLPSGTYQLEARVKNNDDPVIIGGSKRIAEKMFYIPPKRTNYSCNGTQS